MKPDNPTLWLWQQLDTLLSQSTLDSLHAGYKAQSERYNRAAKIRQTRRELHLYERAITTYGPDTSRYANLKKKIEGRKARLAALENEENVTSDDAE